MGVEWPPELVVASYNVHGFEGSDGRFDPERTLRVIETLDVDLLALQEVHALPSPRRRLDVLAEEAGYQVLFGPTLLRQGCEFGNALLTRLPVRDFQRHDLSVYGREPRGALDVRLRWGETRVRAVTAHLGLQPGERRTQIAALARLLEAKSAADELDLTVLLGDFNEWGPGRRRLDPLARCTGPLSRRATFPARRPFLALDRIAVRPASALVAVWAEKSDLTREASDHLPLCGRLRLPSGSRADRAEQRGG